MSVTLIRTGVEFISSCACMDIHVIIVPSCMIFNRANSNVKLASSSRVESSIQVLERSSRVRVLECEGSDLRVKLEYECSSFTL